MGTQVRKYIVFVRFLHKMDDKVYTPTVIDDQPFPGEDVSIDPLAEGSTKDVKTPTAIKSNPFPVKRIATELLSSSLNTKSRKIMSEFQFTKMGAIQIGDYRNGVSGDIKISPDGLVAKNRSGITTIAIDGDTGDAVFAGTIQAGTVVGGKVIVGDDSIEINGETKRIIFYDDAGVPVILIGNA